MESYEIGPQYDNIYTLIQEWVFGQNYGVPVNFELDESG